MEDLLQEQVHECIDDFKDAGIKVWMLTGDKGETAHSIAFSCGLYPNPLLCNFKAFKVADSPFGEDMNELDLHAWRLSNLDSILDFKDTEFGITISGNAIVKILLDPILAGKLVEIFKRCQAVVAFRCSPKEKADIIGLIKDKIKDSVTLAIGDGANDVNMIT